MTEETALKLLQESVAGRKIVTIAEYERSPETEKILKGFVESKRFKDARGGNVFLDGMDDQFVDQGTQG